VVRSASGADPSEEWNMADREHEGVPALRNDEVTGMTEERQEKVIRESARAPRRRAAEEFLDEQEKQAGESKSQEEPRDEA
jgi:hypothetical protein